MSTVHLFVKLSMLMTHLTLSILNCLSFVEAYHAMKAIRNYDNVIDFERSRISYAHFPKDLQYLTKVENKLFYTIKNYFAKLDSEADFFKSISQRAETCHLNNRLLDLSVNVLSPAFVSLLAISLKDFILTFQYIADFEESSQVAYNGWDSTTEKDEYSVIQSNPLWSHRMIWRFVTDIPKIRSFISSMGDSEIRSVLDKIVDSTFFWPTKEDLDNSMDNLLNLHFVYDLNLTKFANGVITNVYTNASLAAIHCFEIAQHALRNRQYTLALEWLEIADIKRVKVKGHPILDYIKETAVSDLLEDIIKEHDDAWMDEDGYLYKFYDKMSSKYTWLPAKTVIQRQLSKGDAKSQPTINDIVAFSMLCQGGNLQSAKEKSKLFCWYESKIHPVWYINPQKMELHNKDPYIFQAYDFIGEEMTKYLIKESTPFMKRSFTAYHKNNATQRSENPKNLDKYYSKERTSMSTNLYEHMYEPRLPALSRKIGHLSGLTASWGRGVPSDELQFAVYATGGYSDVHVDPLKDHDFGSNGNRVSSTVLYLNEVQLGGKTVFSSVGVAVEPVKGSALFWYNLKHNGQVDYNVWHGGCPVLLGEKWVATKWIHSNENMFKRKCTLNKDE